MRVLVACEFSGIVRDAFRNRGHDAWSCDLLPSERGQPHLECDINLVLYDDWDLLIGHPPCDHLAVSGARWFPEKRADGRQQEAVRFFMHLATAMHIPHIAIENPIGIMSSEYRKPDQIIQPYQFGHPEKKATCLWLHNLPKLVPTRNVYEEMLALPLSQSTRVHYASPGPDRWKERSRTLQGIADAMADQWGSVLA